LSKRFKGQDCLLLIETLLQQLDDPAKAAIALGKHFKNQDRSLLIEVLLQQPE
jgi:hypothetical protein